MLFRLKKYFLFVSFALLSINGANALVHGTKAEAEAMVNAAVKLFEEKGEASFAIFTAASTTKDSPFFVKDLYPFGYDITGTCIFHGAKPSLVGQNLMNLRDINGKAFIQEISTTKDKAWVDYYYTNPTDKSVQAKSAYVVRLNDKYVVGVGYYKDE